MKYESILKVTLVLALLIYRKSADIKDNFDWNKWDVQQKESSKKVIWYKVDKEIDWEYIIKINEKDKERWKKLIRKLTENI